MTDAGLHDPEVGAVGAYLYEPDGAVIRAGLVGQVAAAVGGRLRRPHDRLRHRGPARPDPARHAVRRRGRVRRSSSSRCATWLRDRGVGRLTIKKRGTAVEPEQLRRQLRLEGDDEATIVLTRVAGRQSVLAVRPVR